MNGDFHIRCVHVTMKFSNKLRSFVVLLVIMAASFPLAILLTLLSSSFWSWIENNFGIEAYGHSGPAEWCYLASFVIIAMLITGTLLYKNKI